jgi:hypothetical protein
MDSAGRNLIGLAGLQMLGWLAVENEIGSGKKH